MKNIIALLLLLSACDYYDHRLEIVNQTKGEITVETYSDTIPEFPGINKTKFYLDETVIPNDTLKLTEIGKNGWPFAISRSRNKKLNLVVYNIDSLRKYESIDTLIRKRIYKRYEFSEKELQEKNWKVVIGN